MNQNLLIIDENKSNLALIQHQLQNENFQTMTASNNDQALQYLSDHTIDAMIVPQSMSNTSGYHLLKLAKKISSNTIRTLRGPSNELLDMTKPLPTNDIHLFLSTPHDKQKLINHIHMCFRLHNTLILKKKLKPHSSIEALWITDKHGFTHFANPSFCLITHHDPVSIIGKKLDVFDYNRMDKANLSFMQKSIETLGFWQGEIYLKIQSGESYPTILLTTTTHDTYHNIQNYVHLILDIKHPLPIALC